jgi:hypothetical protein
MSGFELASRNKWRFPSPAGLLAAEDLWDLPLQSSVKTRASLDGVAKELHRQIRDEGEAISFVSTAAPKLTENQGKLDLVKRVIEVRLQENAERNDRAERAAKKERLLELISKKEDDALSGLTLEELKKLAESL